MLLLRLDVDDALLEIAKSRIAGGTALAECVAADVRELPFPDGYFDIVIDFGTCYHITRREEALREIARVIVLGGIFVTEMKLSQVLSHPVRTRRRSLPWHRVPMLAPLRRALLWESRRRIA